MDTGLKTLFSTFWNHGRWSSTMPSPEAFAQAKAGGYMFDQEEPLSHDDVLYQLRCVLEKVSPTDVANAFVYSLSTRKLQYRSALGSYYYALAIPEHYYVGQNACEVCNWLKRHPIYEKLDIRNTFNFERHKWGGVRHTHPEYVLFDLQQFLLLPKVTPAEADWAILKSLLNIIPELPPDKKVGALQAQITTRRILPSNKSEVSVLLDILGVCGILSGEKAPCYCDRFASTWQRAPQEHKNDYAYPVNHWHVSDGVNERWFQRVFGFPFSGL